MTRRPLDGARRITGNAASHAEYNVGPATDYGADMREVVRAPFSGWVTRWWSTTGGYTVAITNNQAKFTLQHLSAYAGKSAGQVNEGDVIGYVGNTGSSTTGPHVHCWIILVESGQRISFEQYLVNQGWTTAPLWASVPGPFKTITASSNKPTIIEEEKEQEEMLRFKAKNYYVGGINDVETITKAEAIALTHATPGGAKFAVVSSAEATLVIEGIQRREDRRLRRIAAVTGNIDPQPLLDALSAEFAQMCAVETGFSEQDAEAERLTS
jgi:murein DD-endopeptidase MepM/ murein hydrolase activator NlpD